MPKSSEIFHATGVVNSVGRVRVTIWLKNHLEKVYLYASEMHKFGLPLSQLRQGDRLSFDYKKFSGAHPHKVTAVHTIEREGKNLSLRAVDVGECFIGRVLFYEPERERGVIEVAQHTNVPNIHFKANVVPFEDLEALAHLDGLFQVRVGGVSDRDRLDADQVTKVCC